MEQMRPIAVAAVLVAATAAALAPLLDARQRGIRCRWEFSRLAHAL